jgi:ABC-2 type transport system ATP-binding protein
VFPPRRVYRGAVTTAPRSSSPAGTDAVTLSGVTRRFGSATALDGLSWSARTGQVTCVLGPNGAGKSTAVDVAVGLQAPDDGAVRVLGADPWRAPPAHRARVGVMLQDGGLPQSARPLTLLRHLSRLYATPRPVEALADRLGIGAFADTAVRRLSGGQRQRLALAAALVGDPEVVFLDEPTSGLDPHARREVHTLVRDLARDGVAVVLTTHSFEEAERLADRLVILAAGRSVASGSVAGVCAGTPLEERYFQLTGDSA